MSGKPYIEGTSLDNILVDGWSRGFVPDQTVKEAQEMGYDVDMAAVLSRWAEMDYQFELDSGILGDSQPLVILETFTYNAEKMGYVGMDKVRETIERLRTEGLNPPCPTI